jgi:VWA domain containing CoxE-like protein
MHDAVQPHSPDSARHRQVLYWRLLAATCGLQEQAPTIEGMGAEIAQNLRLPSALLDTHTSIDALLQRYPELAPELDLVGPASDAPDAALRRAMIFSKLLLNAFGPQTQGASVTAAQYNQWLRDIEHLERALGLPPGTLRGRVPPPEGDASGLGAPLVERIQRSTMGIEGDMIKRMALRDLLADDRLAAQIAPSIGVIDLLLRDKANLSGVALRNARQIIRTYIDQLAEALRLEVARAVSPRIDRSVPPKRVFRNLDLKRTIWKNLTNWSPAQRRLYVDRLYFRQTARLKLPTRMIVVVDQSGSMVDAMVQCTILASIFAGLPQVDVHLIAFDTRVLDLTPWVSDPFEVLMRTELGGGTHIRFALDQAAEKIVDPRRTALVLITDFFEGGSNQELLDAMLALRQSGVHMIPVGSVSSSGYFSVNEWFRTRLKDHGMPILTGSPRKLIEQLKKLIVL